jgi:hypothetical protein
MAKHVSRNVSSPEVRSTKTLRRMKKKERKKNQDIVQEALCTASSSTESDAVPSTLSPSDDAESDSLHKRRGNQNRRNSLSSYLENDNHQRSSSESRGPRNKGKGYISSFLGSSQSTNEGMQESKLPRRDSDELETRSHSGFLYRGLESLEKMYDSTR